MDEKKPKRKVVIKPTVDEFVAELPWRDTKSILVHFRSRGGRDFVRFRVWLKHRTKGCWYPTKAGFILPVEHTGALCNAILGAVRGDRASKPQWLVDFEYQERFRGILPAKSA